MARGTHVTIVTGRLSADPGAFETGNGGCYFSIPVNEVWGEEENQKHTEWYNVVCYKGHDAHMKFLKKGSLVQVRGRKRTRQGDDGKTYVNLVADRVEYLDLGNSNEAPSDSSDAPF